MTLRREDNARQGFLDPADFDALLAELRAREPVVADVAECAYFTCLRRGNVLGLTWPMLAPFLKRGRLAGGGLRLPGRITKNRRPSSALSDVRRSARHIAPFAPRASASSARDAASVRRGSHFA